MGEKNLLKQDSSIEEKELNPISGWIALFIGILLFILSPVFGFINLVNTENDIFLIESSSLISEKASLLLLTKSPFSSTSSLQNTEL